MAFRSLMQVMLARIETAYGEDSNPTADANAMLASNVKPSPLVQEMLERKNISSHFGSGGRLEGSRQMDIDFDIELSGSGIPGKPPAYSPLLLSCGMREEVEENVQVSYFPDTDSQHSVTLYFCVDGIRYRMSGARGSVSFKLVAKSIPLISFKFTGIPYPVSDSALPAPNLSGFAPPIPVNESNTGPVSLHAFSGAFSEISLDLGNTVTHRNLMGSESVLITDRNVKGSATLELPSIGRKDYFSISSSGVRDALSITHGTFPGNIVVIECPSVQVSEPQISTQENIEMIQLNLDCLPVSGDDEIMIRLM